MNPDTSRPTPLLSASQPDTGTLFPRRDRLAVLDVEQTRSAETAAYAHMPSFSLMARAGEAAWHWAREQVGSDTRSWLILAGTGNNGGDAFVLARHARLAGITTRVYATGPCGSNATDALQARQQFEASGGEVLDSTALQDIDPSAFACMIDGLLGIGVKNSPTGEVARLIGLVNTAAHPRTLALDVPSGLNADTGHASPGCLFASATLSFIACKPGLLTGDGPDHVGRLQVATLGLDIPAHIIAPSGTKQQVFQAHADSELLALWPKRRLNSHKGRHGDVVILGGDVGMAGAAVLAGRAAVQMGAGRVFLALLDGPHPPGYDPSQPEMMLRSADSMADHGGVWVIGPGAGQSDRMQTLFRQLLRHWQETPALAPHALVLDADALNLVASDPALAVKLQSLGLIRVLTPHPLEAGRLLGRSANSVQADRPAAATALARQLDAVVILKGMGSIVSDGRVTGINLSGGPALASGGTGDVLAGAVGALLAQSQLFTHDATDKRLEIAWQMARLATHLHGATCDALPEERDPPLLLQASELPARMRRVLQAENRRVQ